MEPMIADCGHLAVPSGCTTGYGTGKDGKTYCFKCCGERDIAEMRESGRILLYLVKDAGVRTGWKLGQEHFQSISTPCTREATTWQGQGMT